MSRVDERTVLISDEPMEDLIPEARQRARRRRMITGLVVLAALIVITTVLSVVGGRGATPDLFLTNGPGGGAATSVMVDNVANLAGSNTITASGSHVWVTIDDTNWKAHPFTTRYEIVELNASTGKLVRIIHNESGDLTWPQAMAVSGSHLWVADEQYWRLTEFNVTNGRLVRVISAKADGLADPGAIAVSGGHVWIAKSHVGANSVTELDASNGSLVRVIKAKVDGLNGPSAIAFSGSHVFVLNATGDSVTELDANSGALVRVINSRAGCCAPRQGTFEWAAPVTLAVSGPHLWVVNQHNDANGATSESSVVEFDVSNGSLVRIIRAKADGLYIPRAIAVRRGRVWVDNGNNTISELNASNGSLVRIVNVKLDPKGLNSADGIAVSGPYIVVLNIYSGQKGSVTVINARNGRMVRVIQ